MHIVDLQLTNYRNYDELVVAFSDKVNVILGDNAQGKTNLVEAILMLAIAKSHRTNNDKELIKFDKTFARIQGVIQSTSFQTTLELAISDVGKKAKVNRIEQKKLSEFVGQLHVVLFAPEDLALVKGSPQIRRKFIDIELGQLSSIYLYDLNQYQKVLSQRNTLLKQLAHKEQPDKTLLSIYDVQLAALGSSVIRKRIDFIKKLEQLACPIHQEMTKGNDLLKIVYESSFSSLEGASQLEIQHFFEQQLEKNHAKDIYRGTTSVGPHRDDLIFLVNNRNVQQFGSQGQQRTVALSVKLAEIDLVYEIRKEYPVLILDDVLSELDAYRQTQLLNTIENRVQTFITTTSIDSIQHETIQRAQIFSVCDGKILN